MFSPVHLLIAGVIALILFGPDKLPQLANQLGRALRELNRAKDHLTDSFKMDAEAPRYNSYDNTYNELPSAPLPEEKPWNPLAVEPAAPSVATHTPITPRGDFAAAALSDTSAEYGTSVPAPSPTPVAAAASAPDGAAAYTGPANRDVAIRAAENAVPRS